METYGVDQEYRYASEAGIEAVDLRKVQLTGGSSVTVTLPKHWIDRAGIRPGDVVGCLEQPDGSLVIHPHAKGERPVARYVIELSDLEGEHLFRKIIAAYLSGYDAIVVTSKRPIPAAARLSVRKAARRIMGLEIVEEEPSSITLQDFLDPREFHLDKALRRMSLLAHAMQEEALGTLLNPNADALQSLSDRDDEVDRLYWLISKQYHALLRDASWGAKMELTASQALNFLFVARLVERTADHAHRLAQQAMLLREERIPEGVLVKIEKQGRKAVELFRSGLATFSRQDAKRANEIIDEASEFQRTQEKLLKEITALGGEPVSHLAFILESVSRTAAYAADVAEVAINHKVASMEREPPK